jgi:hypothetical protein
MELVQGLTIAVSVSMEWTCGQEAFRISGMPLFMATLLHDWLEGNMLLSAILETQEGIPEQVRTILMNAQAACVGTSS